MVEYLLQANAAHFDSFAFAQTKFTLTRAYVHDSKNGLEGRWLEEPKPVVSSVLWAFHGDNFRRSETFSDEDIATHKRQEGPLTHYTYSNSHVCWNSTLQLVSEPGQVFQVRTKSLGTVEGFQPFNVGLGQNVLRDRAALTATLRPVRVSYLGERELNGRRLPVLEFQLEFGGPDSLQIDDVWIDPEHGYLPIRIDTYYKTKSTLAMTTVVIQFKELSHGRWIPALYRYVNIKAKPMRCYEIRLDEVDADNLPSPEIFELRVPEHSSRSGHNNITKETYLTKRGRVSLASFGSDGTVRPDQDELELNSRVGTALITATPPGSAPDHGASEVPVWPFASPHGRRFGWSLIALAFGLMVLVLVLRRWYRSS